MAPRPDSPTVLQLDARIGGTYRMSFTHLGTGRGHAFGGRFLELAPYERICHPGAFDDPNLPGEMRTAVTLAKVWFGTELSIVQEGIPEAIPAETCHLGWQESLVLLAYLVEAETPR